MHFVNKKMSTLGLQVTDMEKQVCFTVEKGLAILFGMGINWALPVLWIERWLICFLSVTSHHTHLGKNQQTVSFIHVVFRWCYSPSADWTVGGLLCSTLWLQHHPSQRYWDGKDLLCPRTPSLGGIMFWRQLCLKGKMFAIVWLNSMGGA